MAKHQEKSKDIWKKSPITGLEQVLCEYDDKSGESKMDLSSGFYTNEYPLNHKKNPDLDIDNYQSSMPKLIRDCRFDDGKSYWYPSTVRTKDSMVFPVGKPGDLKWCYAEVKKLTEEMGGEFNLFSCYDIPSQWRKIEIIFDKKTRDKKSTEN